MAFHSIGANRNLLENDIRRRLIQRSGGSGGIMAISIKTVLLAEMRGGAVCGCWKVSPGGRGYIIDAIWSLSMLTRRIPAVPGGAGGLEYRCLSRRSVCRAQFGGFKWVLLTLVTPKCRDPEPTQRGGDTVTRPAVKLLPASIRLSTRGDGRHAVSGDKDRLLAIFFPSQRRHRHFLPA